MGKFLLINYDIVINYDRRAADRVFRSEALTYSDCTRLNKILMRIYFLRPSQPLKKCIFMIGGSK